MEFFQDARITPHPIIGKGGETYFFRHSANWTTVNTNNDPVIYVIIQEFAMGNPRVIECRETADLVGFFENQDNIDRFYNYTQEFDGVIMCILPEKSETKRKEIVDDIEIT
jgi:hypothetical protein